MIEIVLSFTTVAPKIAWHISVPAAAASNRPTSDMVEPFASVFPKKHLKDTTPLESVVAIKALRSTSVSIAVSVTDTAVVPVPMAMCDGNVVEL